MLQENPGVAVRLSWSLCVSVSLNQQAVIVLRWSISAGSFSCEQVMEGSLAGAPF